MLLRETPADLSLETGLALDPETGLACTRHLFKVLQHRLCPVLALLVHKRLEEAAEGLVIRAVFDQPQHRHDVLDDLSAPEGYAVHVEGYLFSTQLRLELPAGLLGAVEDGDVLELDARAPHSLDLVHHIAHLTHVVATLNHLDFLARRCLQKFSEVSADLHDQYVNHMLTF